MHGGHDVLQQSITTHFPTLGTSIGQLTEALQTTGTKMVQAMEQAGATSGPLAQPLAALPALLEGLVGYLSMLPNVAGAVDYGGMRFNLLPFGWSPANPLHSTKPAPTK